jgi:hypothetical protein
LLRDLNSDENHSGYSNESDTSLQGNDTAANFVFSKFIRTIANTAAAI